LLYSRKLRFERKHERAMLASKRLTLRDKDKLRKAMGIMTELHASPKRIKKPPTYPPVQLMAAPPESDPLAHVLTSERSKRFWASAAYARAAAGDANLVSRGAPAQPQLRD
jgi:hypothetical protein